MITKDGAKMSKSKGNVVSPATIVERYGADTGALLHPVHRPARPGRRLVRRAASRACTASSAACGARAAEAADELPDQPVPDEPNADDAAPPAQGALGDREGHAATWPAASRSTRRSPRCMELINEVTPAKRGERRAGRRALRAGDRRLAAVPVRAARRGRRLRPADRPSACGRSRGRRPTRRCLETDTFELVCQVNGKVRDRVTAPAAAPTDELHRLCAREQPNVRAHLDGKRGRQGDRRAGQAVNLVVR